MLKINNNNQPHTNILCAVIRSKNFILLTLFILTFTMGYLPGGWLNRLWIITMQSKNLIGFVAETHRQVNNAILNPQQNIGGNARVRENPNLNVNVKREGLVDHRISVSEEDNSYFEMLGFTSDAHLYTNNSKFANSSYITVTTGVKSHDLSNVIKLIQNVQRRFIDYNIAIFDFGMRSYDIVKLSKHCNASINCNIRTFDFSKFPNHVRDRTIKAYRPLAIQIALQEFGSIWWMDSGDIFLHSNISAIEKVAQSSGVAAWRINSGDPTTTMTHPKMFQFYKTLNENYYFQHMVSADHLVLYNTPLVHLSIMKPWIKCALSKECIWPKGSQSKGCTLQKHPRFKYSGCHLGDVSALNIVLGMVFATAEDADELLNSTVENSDEEADYLKDMKKENFHAQKAEPYIVTEKIFGIEIKTTPNPISINNSSSPS